MGFLQDLAKWASDKQYQPGGINSERWNEDYEEWESDYNPPAQPPVNNLQQAYNQAPPMVQPVPNNLRNVYQAAQAMPLQRNTQTRPQVLENTVASPLNASVRNIAQEINSLDKSPLDKEIINTFNNKNVSIPKNNRSGLQNYFNPKSYQLTPAEQAAQRAKIQQNRASNKESNKALIDGLKNLFSGNIMSNWRKNRPTAQDIQNYNKYY